MRYLGWALVQDNWDPYYKGWLRHNHTQREEDCHLQVKERDLKESPLLTS